MAGHQLVKERHVSRVTLQVSLRSLRHVPSVRPGKRVGQGNGIQFRNTHRDGNV
jgi:hypothetical protein